MRRAASLSPSPLALQSASICSRQTRQTYNTKLDQPEKESPWVLSQLELICLNDGDVQTHLLSLCAQHAGRLKEWARAASIRSEACLGWLLTLQEDPGPPIAKMFAPLVHNG